MGRVVVTICAIFICHFSPPVARSANNLPCDQTQGQLRQGWSEDCRRWFYHSTQGSQLIPYEWVRALEQPESTQDHIQLFRDPKALGQFGFLYESDQPSAEDLPIGFAQDSDPPRGIWLGMTCATCHTGQMELNGRKIRIDGGSGMVDLIGFLRFMYRSFDETLRHEDKLNRFVATIREKEPNTDRAQLVEALRRRTQVLKEQAGLQDGLLNFIPLKRCGSEQNPCTFYEFGRVDAIALLTNQILATQPAIKENYRRPDAPVSYPFLWYAPRLPKLQWNGSAPNAIARNVGEALGVFVHFVPPKGNIRDVGKANELFASSINMTNLQTMWSLVGELKPPVWRDVVGQEPESSLLTQGKSLYEKRCVKCHKIVQPIANREQDRELVFVTPAAKTDEALAIHFSCRKARPALSDVLDQIDQIGLTETHGAATPMLLAPVLGSLKTLAMIANRDQLDCAAYKAAQAQEEPRARYLLATVGAGVILRQVKKDPELAGVLLKDLLATLEQSVRDLLQSGLAVPLLDVPQMPGGIFGQPFDFLQGTRKAPEAAYKAGPLHGVWATAPFLHNGSVPTLDQLLRPVEKRDKQFCITREFDPVTVGLKATNLATCDQAHTFDTSQPGNSHKGHEYGTDNDPEGNPRLTDGERKALIEFLKTL